MSDLVHKGHRQRMRRKFSDFGAHVFDTYELLEMLLYHTVPVKDTNPIAKRLLMRFGSLDGVFCASVSELTEVEGVGAKTAEMICAIGKIMDICASETEDEIAGVKYETYDGLGEHIVSCFEGCDGHMQLIFSFDNEMRLIGVDKLYELDYASGKVQPKAFMDASVKRNASVVVVAHNHPHGPLYPTEGDMQTNSIIERAMSNIGVLFMEHYIVCGNRYLGFMKHTSSIFSQEPAIRKFLESMRF